MSGAAVPASAPQQVHLKQLLNSSSGNPAASGFFGYARNQEAFLIAAVGSEFIGVQPYRALVAERNRRRERHVDREPAFEGVGDIPVHAFADDEQQLRRGALADVEDPGAVAMEIVEPVPHHCGVVARTAAVLPQEARVQRVGERYGRSIRPLEQGASQQ